ncbi:phosphatase PAP2 family protein [Cupriavidus alkaliphilus]|uniref:Putative membrane protein n=1 Tax=Cupriavidus alkaliphilus TaxID=942866 RepID=A0A7W4YS16_9BURK|nr:phosphatase PAP2 family protein [Cupriavidus alkaliphilus]MBB3008564.1 putative membrane protein [Cupriavidus alkaliphilus]
MILLVLALDGAWLALSGRSVTAASLRGSCLGVAMLAAIAVALSLIASHPRISATLRGLHYRRLALVAHSGALLVAFTNVMGVMSYLLVTLAPPLVDGQLAALDQMLGFDWPRAYAWVRAHPGIDGVLKLAYMSGLAQLVLIPMLTGLLGQSTYLREFIANLMLSCVLLLLIAAPWPAAGAYVSYGLASPDEVATVAHFAQLRDGTMHVFDLGHMQGLVSLPSYHTALALIFIQAMRWTRVGFLVACVLNGLMILSTPTEGGHYLVDVIAGVGLWALSAGMLHAFAARRAPALVGQAGAQLA